MPELSREDAMEFAVNYCQKKMGIPHRDAAKFVNLYIVGAGLLELITSAYNQGVRDEKGEK